MRAELAFSTDDLARARFAVSPMWEIVTGVRALVTDPVPALHRRWADQVRPRLAAAGLDRGALFAMIPPQGHLPDFLTPAPAGAGPRLAEELAAIRATDPGQVRHDLGLLDPLPTRLRPFLTDPRPALERLAEEIERYWELALAPYWSRIHAVLEADLRHRALRLAEHGAALLLDELHPTVRWQDGTLRLAERHCTITRETSGRGLVLVPSVFAWPRVLTRTLAPEPPTLAYPARGAATLWEERADRAPGEAVCAVLGRSRAQLLGELDTPASTTELARRCGLSPAGTSQHLTALRDAGLVSAHRAGRSVLYARTAAADTLLAAAG
ncbi:DUF5937 family protein [Kitasatospora sp. NPDC004240]